MDVQKKTKMNTIDKQMMKIFFGGGLITALSIVAFLWYMPLEVQDDERFVYFVGAVVMIDFIIVAIGLLRRRQMINDLKQQGRYLEATVTHIKKQQNQNPPRYTIECTSVHPMTGMIMQFVSGSVSKDPSKHVTVGATINVFYDMNDPYYYWVDIAHLK